MTTAEIEKLLADYQAGGAIGLYDKIDDLARLARDQPRELERVNSINVKLCADFNQMNQLGAKQDRALAILENAVDTAEDLALDQARELAEKDARIAELEGALDRQCDNIAFIINHVTLPGQWLDKFQFELEQDRAALKEQPE